MAAPRYAPRPNIGESPHICRESRSVVSKYAVALISIASRQASQRYRANPLRGDNSPMADKPRQSDVEHIRTRLGGANARGLRNMIAAKIEEQVRTPARESITPRQPSSLPA